MDMKMFFALGFKEGHVGQYNTFTCPVTLSPDKGMETNCRHNIMCVTVPNGFEKIWSQCYAGIRFSWYRNGMLFSERVSFLYHRQS